MLGAIIGDIVGSRFEFDNHRSKVFPLFEKGCFATDDSIMTLAIAKAMVDADDDYTDIGELAVKAMREVGRPYPRCGYGGTFLRWMYSDVMGPYNSFGNGAAMRISPCAYAAEDMSDALELARRVTEVTHNHPEGIKGAEATTAAIFLARRGASIEAIRDHVEREYYNLNFTLDGIRDTYRFNETCQETVPQAIEAFLESTSFEDAIRNAISIGGDSDTLAAITGSIAEAFYGVPDELETKALSYLDKRLLRIYNAFCACFPRR